MNVTEMNDRVLIGTYLNLEDKDSRDDLIIELLERGFINIIDGDERIVFPKCNKKRKRICALCIKTPWCLDYEPGGLGVSTLAEMFIYTKNINGNEIR